MIIKASMHRKDKEISAQDFVIDKVLEISESEFASLWQNLSVYRDFIAEYNAEYGDITDGNRHALLVLGKGYSDGILINTEGSDYARYSALIPYARQIIAYEKMNPALKAYCEIIEKKVDDIVKTALEKAGNGEYTLELQDINNDLGHTHYDERLVEAMLYEREEFELVDSAGGCVMLTPKKTESETEEDEEFDSEHYLDEDYGDEIEIMCAKHTLWIYQGDDDNRFDLDGYKVVNIDFDNKNLCGAKMSNCVIQNCNFRDASMSDFKADNVRFINCQFDGMVAEEAEFTNCQFEECSLKKATLTHSDLSDTDFTDCQFFRTSFDKCLIKGMGVLDAEGNIPFALPSMTDATQERDEWESDIGEGVIQE